MRYRALDVFGKLNLFYRDFIGTRVCFSRKNDFRIKGLCATHKAVWVVII